ncbi:MAG: alpha/beta hydrolase [Devosia sp.]
MPSPIGWLDRIVSKDGSSHRIATGVSFGVHPLLKLDLYAPRRPAGPLPLLIFVYGGGWDSGDRRDYDFAGRALAALGFLVAIPGYRVFPEVRFPDFVEDIADAAKWLAEHAPIYGGDRKRLFLGGHSAGAYNAMMVALQPARFGAPGLAGTIKGVVGLSGPYDFYPFDVKQSIDAFGQSSDPEGTQPINLVTAHSPPMLLIHGERDRTVGDYHTVRLAQKLRALGVPVTERHYARLTHPMTLLGLMRPLRRVLPVWADVAAFLRAAINQTGI